MGLDFFRVSENDLMQQVALQDAFSMLRIINGRVSESIGSRWCIGSLERVRDLGIHVNTSSR